MRLNALSEICRAVSGGPFASPSVHMSKARAPSIGFLCVLPEPVAPARIGIGSKVGVLGTFGLRLQHSVGERCLLPMLRSQHRLERPVDGLAFAEGHLRLASYSQDEWLAVAKGGQYLDRFGQRRPAAPGPEDEPQEMAGAVWRAVDFPGG